MGNGKQDLTDFTVSLHLDLRLYREELAVSVAHARMLARQGVIGEADAEKIVGGLAQIKAEIESDQFVWKAELEDIHMNVEARLFELVGEVAGLLHTGRSRNDLVATDTRLYVMRLVREMVAALRELQRALVDVAGDNVETYLPAYTHIQRGQPTVLAHHLLAYYEMLGRDVVRFEASFTQADELPLGAGAATGVPYDLDREFVARELGFSKIARNSMDAVSNRDYIVEFVMAGALCMTHLSRLAEELVWWSSDEFGFVTMADEYTTGSSIMPQKRNPDFAELVRGRVGVAYGALMNVLTILKGLPLTYNRDMQEDKAPLFDVVDVALPCLRVMAGMVRTMAVNRERMRGALDEGAILATDMADFLVGKGMAFRAAYLVVRKLNEQCRADGRSLADLSLDELRAVSPLFDEGVKRLGVAESVAARQVFGGTAPEQVRERLAEAQRELKAAG